MSMHRAVICRDHTLVHAKLDIQAMGKRVPVSLFSFLSACFIKKRYAIFRINALAENSVILKFSLCHEFSMPADLFFYFCIYFMITNDL